MPGDLLDLILIALAAAFAVAGYRQGFIVGLMSFVGFLGGAAVGALFSPRLARDVVSGPAQQALLALVIVFLAAMVGQLVASAIGASLRSRVTWRPVAFVDAVGGAGVSVVSVLLIAWLIGSAVASSPFPVISGQVNHSAVLRSVDRLMPPAAGTTFSGFRRVLASGPYAQVFGALGAESAVSVPPPNPRVTSRKAVTRAEASIVKITGTAPSCSLQIEGSGFVVAPHHVLTNAHVVAGVTQDLTVRAYGGAAHPAHVVRYDPERDVAVLDVPGLNRPSLRFARSDAQRGDSAAVAGYPEGGRLRVVPARVGGEQKAAGKDIYQTTTVVRHIYSVRAVVKPGNSGGPLLTPGGEVDGVVFASAVDVRDTGYALTAGEVSGDVAAGRAATRAVSTRSCA